MPIPSATMATLLDSTEMVQVVKGGATGGEMSPVSCLTAGEIIIHRGTRYRVLAVHTISRKAMVEPINPAQEAS